MALYVRSAFLATLIATGVCLPCAQGQFAYDHLVAAKQKMQRNDVEGALGDLKRAVELNPNDVTPLIYLGDYAVGVGRLDLAIDVCTRAIAITERYPLAFSIRARAKHGKGDFQAAIADLDRAIAMNPRYAHALSYRGLAKAMIGDSRGALDDCNLSVTLLPDALAYRYRGDVRKRAGDIKGSEEDFVQAARLRAGQGIAATPQPTAPQRWEAAVIKYQSDGKTGNALRVLQNERDYLRARGETDSALYLNVSSRLGVLLKDLGNFDDARRIYSEVISIAEHLHNSRAELGFRNGLAWLLIKEKKYAEAEILAAARLRELEAVVGPHDPLILDALQNLVSSRLPLGKFQECESLIQRIQEVEFAPRVPSVRETYPTGGGRLLNLGTFYLEQGNLAEARSWLERGASRELLNGGKNFDQRIISRNLARLALDLDDRKSALSQAWQIAQLERHIIRDVFPELSENERLNFVQDLEPLRWFATVGEPHSIAQAVLQTKAITLDRLLSLPSVPLATDPFAELLQPENASLGFSPHKSDVGSKPNVPETSASTARMELSRETNLTPEQVCRSLPAGTAVVEFVRYAHYVGRYKDEARYGALVILSNASTQFSPIVWLPLGAADPIDRDITALQTELQDPLFAGMVASRLKSLYNAVWAHVSRILPPDTQNVFISPDGQTCFLPFGALLDAESKFLGDKYAVMFLSTTRDLFVSTPATPSQERELAVFAAPSFGSYSGSQGNEGNRFRDVDARSMGNLRLIDLPGSRREADFLKQAAQARQYQSKLFIGASASKANVQGLVSPYIVHFATHGFFLPKPDANNPGNPMDRSGLALAGAQTTLRAMVEGRAPPAPINDGLLTARDIARLPLAGTWMAVVSACESGRGESRDGEGVLGLRRAFLAAGVQNSVFALWKVQDRETAEFMKDFYTRALESSDAPMALALTQREWLQRLRAERGIAAAVITAGGFVLNTSRRLPVRGAPLPAR